eukprot:2155694-Rhodomonas_salina.1
MIEGRVRGRAKGEERTDLTAEGHGGKDGERGVDEEEEEEACKAEPAPPPRQHRHRQRHADRDTDTQTQTHRGRDTEIHTDTYTHAPVPSTSSTISRSSRQDTNGIRNGGFAKVRRRQKREGERGGGEA